MNLKTALRVDRDTRLALVGAGGKTSAMFQLASQLEPPVIVTSSTHLGAWQIAPSLSHIVACSGEDVIKAEVRTDGVTVITGPVGIDGRTEVLSADILLVVKELADSIRAALLIEADGSRQKPLKAPAAHEPAIPGWVNCVVVCAGLSGLWKPLDETHVHRAEIFAQLAGLTVSEVITPDALARVLLHPQGGLKNIPKGARRMVLLNQTDSSDLRHTASQISEALVDAYDAVMVTNLAAGREASVSAVHEHVAGIILAAGGSRRFGRPKVLLEWHRKALVRHVAETALAAGLRPLVIVTGEEDERIRTTLSGLDVQIVQNSTWNEGQSTSLHAGLSVLPKQCGAAVFLLADQPRISEGLISSLKNAHSQSLAPIVAPFSDGRRGNPVLFDRSTFSALVQVQGDVGGRALFSQFPVLDVPVVDASFLLDIDTLDDYHHLTVEEDVA